MCCNTNLDTIIEFCSVFVAIIGLIIAAIHFYRQNRLTFYAQYTKRNMEIMKEMPSCVLYKEDKKLEDNKKKEDEDKYEKFKVNVFLYFDLCSEEYYLHRNKYIEEKVWNDWKEGMADFFNRLSVNKQLQEIVKEHKDAYPDFIDFLKYELQIKNL